MSGGKDGHLNTYELTLRAEESGGIDLGMTLSRVNREHVASVTVLASLCVTSTGERIVAGFQASDYVVRTHSRAAPLPNTLRTIICLMRIGPTGR